MCKRIQIIFNEMIIMNMISITKKFETKILLIDHGNQI